MQSKSKANRIITLVIIIILAALFTFPLYWIITGSFKTAKEVNSVTPVWWPSEWTLKNYQTLMSKLKAPLWEFYIPFSQYFSADGSPIVFSAGPTVPGAIRWMFNTVWMAGGGLRRRPPLLQRASGPRCRALRHTARWADPQRW